MCTQILISRSASGGIQLITSVLLNRHPTISQAAMFPTSTGPSTLQGSIFSSSVFSTHAFPFETLRKVKQAVLWPLFSVFLFPLPHRPSYKLNFSWAGASPATPPFSSSVFCLCVFISLISIYNYLVYLFT